MSKSSNKFGHQRDTANQDFSRSGILSDYGAATRNGPEIMISNLACHAVSKDWIRREISNALKGDEVSNVRRITFSKIARGVANLGSDSQALIDRFLLRRAKLEEWARDIGFRVVSGYLRPVEDTFSAVFEVEPRQGSRTGYQKDTAAE